MGVAVKVGTDVGREVGVDSGEDIGLIGDVAGLTGVELHATLSDNASKRITRNFRSILHLIKYDVCPSS